MTPADPRSFVSPAREAVLGTLSRSRESGPAVSFTEDPALARLSSSDRHFADRLRRGVLQNLLLLDEMLRRGGHFSFERTEPALLWILRMAAYQKAFMGGVPDYAIGQQSVALARRCCGARAAGFMNAVLRKCLAGLPGDPGETAALLASEAWRTLPLSVRCSVPEPEIALLRRGYGSKPARAVIESLNRPGAGVCLRPNTLRTTSEELAAALSAEGHRVIPSRLVPGALEWKPGGSDDEIERASAGPVWNSAAWKRGECAVQDPGAMLAALVVAPATGETVLDWCAAPGGKTGQLRELMRGKGRLVALEINPDRREVLRETLHRLYGPHGGAAETDEIEIASEPDAIPRDLFDAVLVDAPCLALGLMRRHPEIRWDRRHERLAEITRTQSDVLEAAAARVAPGGRLCYVTCSPTREENEDVVARLLAERPDFRVENPTASLPPCTTEWTSLNGSVLRTRPDMADTDGFAISLLRRADQTRSGGDA